MKPTTVGDLFRAIALHFDNVPYVEPTTANRRIKHRRAGGINVSGPYRRVSDRRKANEQ